MKRRETDSKRHLADRWSAPGDFVDDGGVGEPVACLSTTYEFDAAFFEAELLPRFLGLRFDCTENERTFIVEREEALGMTQCAVLVDISKFDPRQTTLQWDQIPIQCPRGIQHAKLTILAWERLVRLIVTSANLTKAGYRRNREIFAALDFFDDPSSTPIRVLRDALDFISLLTVWSRALDAAAERIRETVQMLRAHVRRWKRPPADFTPRERPRVTLVVGHPAHEGVPARSPLTRLLALLGSRRVGCITVVSPFVGQENAGNTDPVLERLAELPVTRDAEGWLVVPEAPSAEDSERPIVPFPETFGLQWKELFDGRGGAYVVPVPLYDHEEDKGNRELHAKAIHLECDNHELLMIGSSNFTSAGMGIGAFNCEANLVFEDAKRDGMRMEDRLGQLCTWENWFAVDDLAWQQPQEAPEDARPTEPLLPAFFACACYSQVTGEIKVKLDRDQPEPPKWSISLPGEVSAEAAPLFACETTSLEESLLTFHMQEAARAVHLTALRVQWVDDAGKAHEGFLAVLIESAEDLLPPEEFCNLNINTIIECLLSGKEPAEWVDQQRIRAEVQVGAEAAIDSLKAVDTSGYLLYRVRRFGRALTAMAERIRNTSPTPGAIGYRLSRDPLGPVRLAEALCKASSHEGASDQERQYRLYALAETILCLGYVCRDLRVTKKGTRKRLIPLFKEATDRIRALAQSLLNEDESIPEDLRKYLYRVETATFKLVNAKEN